MKRLAFALGVFSLAAAIPFYGIAGGRFDQKLSKDQRIVHALSRLTYGARRGDVEQVRRIGLEKWIDQQLHPERIPENPVLQTKLEGLGTLQMATAQILETYQLRPGVGALKKVQSPAPLLTLITPQQRQTLIRGS